MTSFWPLVLALCALAALCVVRWSRPGSRMLLMAGADGDEDMKIAPGHFSGSRPPEDIAELAAQDFLRQKKSGNIDRARDLGKRFALALLDGENGPLKGELEGQSPQVQHHQFLLYSYVVSHVIADHSPNSILAQTSLNVFYSEVENVSADLYRHVSDMAAFSLYILFERSRDRAEDEIGRIFAELCGAEGDRQLIDYGNRLYDQLYRYCVDEIRKTQYQDT